jgi:hypothetical protein
MATDMRENANANLPTELSEGPAGLIRQEIELMAAELVQRGRYAGVGAGLLSGAGVLGVSSFNALTAALIAALERRPARGAILVAAIYGVGAGALADAGVKRLKQTPASAGASGRDIKGTSRPKAPRDAVKGAKSSAKAVKRKSPTKAAQAGASRPKAVKGKSPARAARTARPRATRT